MREIHQLGHTLALLSEGAGGGGCKLHPKSPRSQESLSSVSNGPRRESVCV